MPIRYADPPPEPAQHPMLGSLVRLLSGVGSALTQPAELTGLGMALPAGIAGGGESLAEYLEGSKQSPGRIAAETAIGAVPLGKVFQGGRALASALRSGVYAGGGEAMREASRGEKLDPTRIGLQAAMGGGTAGVLSKMLGPGRAAVQTTPAAGYEVEQTSQAVRPRAIPGTGEPLVPMGPAREPSGGPVPYGASEPAPYRSAARQAIREETKAGIAAGKAAKAKQASATIASAREGRVPQPPSISESVSAPTELGTERMTTRYTLPKEEEAVSRWTEADLDPVQAPKAPLEPEGLLEAQVPEGAQTPPLPEVVSRRGRPGAKTVEGFNSRVNKIADMFGVPAPAAVPTEVTAAEPAVETIPESNPFSVARAKKASDAEFAAAQQKTFTETGQVLPREISVSPLEAHTMASEEPSASETPGALAQFFKTKQGATGKNYRLAKDAEAAGEIPTSSYARDSHLIQLGKAPEGPLAGPGAEGAPTPVTPPPVEPEPPQRLLGAAGMPPPDYPAAVTPEAKRDLLTRLRDMGGFGGEKGAVNPTLLSLLARAGVGAAMGAPLGASVGHPYLGALAGAVGGGVLSPGIQANIPAIGEALANSREKTGPALDALNKVRFASLLSPTSVVKKFAGDVGGLTNAIVDYPEHADDLLRVLTGRGPGGGYGEAFQAGREAFNRPIEEATTGIEKIASRGPLSWMGRTMAGATAGTKNLLEQAGFPEELQRYFTMTSEPTSIAGKAMLKAQRQSPAIQHFAPFARMGINRIERGMERSPLGLVDVAMAKNPEERTRALRRAVFGTGLAGAAYAATPEDWVKQHPVATTMVAALGGPAGIPLAAGMALKTSAKSPGGEAARTVSREVPGLRFIEDISQSPTAALRNYLAGYTNFLRPISEGLNPGSSEPEVSGPDASIFSKMLSNIPGVAQQLPQKPVPRGRPRRVRYE